MSFFVFVFGGGFPGGSDGKESTCNAETWVWSLGQEDPLEKEMATHSRILAWRILRTEEPDKLHISWGCKESNSTEWLTLSHFDTWVFLSSCISIPIEISCVILKLKKPTWSLGQTPEFLRVSDGCTFASPSADLFLRVFFFFLMQT